MHSICSLNPRPVLHVHCVVVEISQLFSSTAMFSSLPTLSLSHIRYSRNDCYLVLRHFTVLSLLFFLFCFCFDFEDKISLCGPGCPKNRFADQAALEFSEVSPDCYN